MPACPKSVYLRCDRSCHCKQRGMLSNQRLQCTVNATNITSPNCDNFPCPTSASFALDTGSVQCNRTGTFQRTNGCGCWIATHRRRESGNILRSFIHTQANVRTDGQRYNQYAKCQQRPNRRSRTYCVCYKSCIGCCGPAPG